MKYFMVVLLWLSTSAFAVDEAGYGTIPFDDFHVRSVSTGDPYSKAIAKLGKPLRENRTNSQPEPDVGETVKLYYAGLYVSLFEGEVGEISITKGDVAVKGVRVGSRVKDAIEKIGTAEPITINGRTSLRYRCVAKNGIVTDAELRVFFERDTITEIALWFPTT